MAWISRHSGNEIYIPQRKGGLTEARRREPAPGVFLKKAEPKKSELQKEERRIEKKQQKKEKREKRKKVRKAGKVRSSSASFGLRKLPQC